MKDRIPFDPMKIPPLSMVPNAVPILGKVAVQDANPSQLLSAATGEFGKDDEVVCLLRRSMVSLRAAQNFTIGYMLGRGITHLQKLSGPDEGGGDGNGKGGSA